jgi:hypothetical protein
MKDVEKTKPESKAQTRWDAVRDFLDLPSTQIFVLVSIYLDILLGATQTASAADETTTFHFEPIRALILFIHATELLAQFLVFRNRFFESFYPLDGLIIASRIAGVGHHHTNFLRVWRLRHLVDTYLAIDTKEHIETKRELSRQLQAVDELKKKSTSTEFELENERALRKKNEEMVNGSREEITTLREALKIAALEVAAAMQGNELEMDDLDSVLGPPAPVLEERNLTIRSISPVVE